MSLVSKDPKATATWRPALQSIAPVRISMWVPAKSGSDSAAVVEITADDKTAKRSINQSQGNPRWEDLGTYNFKGRGDEIIRLSPGAPGRWLRAAALKLEICEVGSDHVWQAVIMDELTLTPPELTAFDPKSAKAGPPDPEKWVLTFSDDFNGDSLDWNIWESAKGNTWGKLMSARFPENAVVKDGLLHLVTRKEDRGGKQWTTAFIWTKSFKQKYGYWEARYRYAPTPGLNQAFWTMYRGKDKENHFEIDVNEGHYPHIVNATLHQSGLPSVGKRYATNYDLSKDFHYYAVEWNEKEVIYFFDGKEIQRLPNIKGHSEVPIMFSTAVLHWAGAVTDSLNGASMDVDWVRIYRKK